jgi:hypothetical protein
MTRPASGWRTAICREIGLVESAGRSPAVIGLGLREVTNIGDYEDVLELVEQMGEDELRRVLTQAEIGQFNERVCRAWHEASRVQVPIPGVRRAEG